MLRQFKFILLVFVGFIFSAINLNAQVARFHHLSVDDGLTQNSITSIAQDHKGFIWLGTYAGLNKYDGYKITQYIHSPDDSSSISPGTIRCIFPDNENNLWIGTSAGGMCKLDLSNNQFTRFMVDSASDNSIASNSVHYIAEFTKGTLYLATSNGVNMFDKKTGKFKHFAHDDKNENSLLANTTKAICMDQRGHIWMGHSGFGLTEYIAETGKFIRYTPTDKTETHLSEKQIRCMFADSKGLIWISLWNAGINIYDTKTGQFIHSRDESGILKPIQRIGLVSQFYEDSKGNMWFCTAEEGLVRYNRNTAEVNYFSNNPDDAESIIDNTVFSILEDKNGLIWAGTWKGGASYFDPRALNFGFHKHSSDQINTLANNNVYSFKEINDNEVLIGTAGNVCYFNPKEKTFSPFIINPSDKEALLPKSIVLNILNDVDGSTWFGTAGGGAYRYFPQTKKFKNYNTTPDTNSLSFHTINAMVLDNKNNLWIATRAGLELFNRDKNNFTHFYKGAANSVGLSSDKILDMVKAADGKIWMATSDAGISILDPEKKTFSNLFSTAADKELPDISLSTIYVDDSGIFWLGTSAGLASYNPANKKVKNYAQLFPKLKTEFYAITKDKSENLWLTSGNGLYRFNTKTEQLKIFKKEDGIQGKEFQLRSILQLKNGTILAGGTNGFNCFLPEALEENKRAPSITLTNFQVLNKPYPLSEDISYTRHITLSYLDYFFSFDFAAFDFSDPSQNQFMYKLDGFNKDWVTIGNRHDVTFTNLDPGNYTLNIKAANSGGYWNEEPLQITITITPPFWRTNWFYLLCIISGVFAIYAFIKYREKKLIKEKALLEKKVEERTEELNLEKHKVEEAHKDIKDSILYAQKIQSAIIPTDEEFKNLVPDSFVLFKPKDIVSGDFYWISGVQDSEFKIQDSGTKIESEHRTLNNTYTFIAIADCTGHGVPGGFMTMLGNGLLNEIVNEHHIIEPAEILNKLREKIISALKQTGKSGENKDGMDIVLLRINKNKNELCYAAANNGLMIVKNNICTEYSGDKQPVGIYGDVLKPFNQFTIALEKGDCIYSFTDGYPDQFGGPKGKKFKYKKLNEILISNSNKALEEQKDILANELLAWKGDLEQVDDICVVGIRV